MIGELLLGNADLVCERDTGFVSAAPVGLVEDDPLLALDHATALRAIATPLAPEPLA